MQPINNHGEDRIRRVLNQCIKMPDRILLAHLQMKSLFNLQHHLIRLQLDIRNVGIDHQTEQIEDQIRGFPERGVSCKAVLLELLILLGRGPTHAVDHFLAELHGWREGLWVSAEDEAKVCVEEVAVRGEEQVVEMAISDAEEVGDHAVARAGFDEDV